MSMSEEHAASSPRLEISMSQRPSRPLSAFVLAAAIAISGCATAGERGEVPTFGDATAKELAFNKKRVTLVFAVDEDGNVQRFRARDTKFFSVRDLTAQPLKAGSIAAFESFSIIKTTNPKVCWPNAGGGVDCVEYVIP